MGVWGKPNPPNTWVVVVWINDRTDRLIQNKLIHTPSFSGLFHWYCDNHICSSLAHFDQWPHCGGNRYGNLCIGQKWVVPPESLCATSFPVIQRFMVVIYLDYDSVAQMYTFITSWYGSNSWSLKYFVLFDVCKHRQWLLRLTTLHITPWKWPGLIFYGFHKVLLTHRMPI